MVDQTNRRRFLGASGIAIVGLSGCLGSFDDESETVSSENSNPDSPLEWGEQGSEHATQECPDELGYWKWVLTPGGPDAIVVDDDEPVLTVEFEDGESETATGYRPGGGSGAVHFDVFKAGGGTVERAAVEFSGGGNNVNLTISEGGCVEDEDEPDDPVEPTEPTVVTEPATDINGSTAMLHGYLSDIGDYEGVTVFFEYRAVGAEEWTETDSQDRSAPGEFSQESSGLEAGGEYEFRAVATAGENGVRVEGAILEFEKDEPDEEHPVVVTKPATDINGSTAMLHGELTDLGTFEAVAVSFQYRVTGTTDWLETESQELTELSEFSQEVDGLEEGTTYEFTSVAEANDTIVTGAILEFTKEDPDDEDPDDEDPENGDPDDEDADDDPKDDDPKDDPDEEDPKDDDPKDDDLDKKERKKKEAKKNST